jgi:two-component system cell cycle response regulator CpdR
MKEMLMTAVDTQDLPRAMPAARPTTILLVEDDQWMADFVLELLTKHSAYEVVRVPNGREAYRYLSSAKADLILTDILMPEMDGIELIQKRAELAPDVPLIAFSGGGFRLDQTELLKYAEVFGAQVVLEKPVKPQVLLDSIERLLAERRP